MKSVDYRHWRRLHIAASSLVGLIAIVHSVFTWFAYQSWTANAAWFLGTGLGLLLLSALNLSHIGIEPCRQPTTRLVHAANVAFLIYGVFVMWAVPQPPGIALVIGLTAQAIAGRATLPGAA